MTVTIQIGNSDDKLKQNEWADFVDEAGNEIAHSADQIHFFAPSQGAERWQNAAWVIEINPSETERLSLRAEGVACSLPAGIGRVDRGRDAVRVTRLSMTITIDNEGASYCAKLTIDGKTVEVTTRGVKGLLPHEEQETLGGLIACGLAPAIIRILQSEAFAAEAQGVIDPRCFTWERLNRGAQLAAQEQLFRRS